jgi:hypothetical protein
MILFAKPSPQIIHAGFAIGLAFQVRKHSKDNGVTRLNLTVGNDLVKVSLNEAQ